MTSRSPITRVSKPECEPHPGDLHPDSGQALAVETKSITTNTIVKEKDAIRTLFGLLMVGPSSKKKANFINFFNKKRENFFN
ncbi:MAG: hypothetical protein DSO07_02810 [Thermoproteota archaeon]|nr:MAG: hypothetical protein DSO07_02810 [Candidatus Korarchaeota archaeon]